eukprot:m.170608 g.170608  ORF g.170608 m.170608 type:complete len:119 (+) comp14535_c1_seq2:1074-1430(+)
MCACGVAVKATAKLFPSVISSFFFFFLFVSFSPFLPLCFTVCSHDKHVGNVVRTWNIANTLAHFTRICKVRTPCYLYVICTEGTAATTVFGVLEIHVLSKQKFVHFMEHVRFAVWTAR